MQSCMHAANLDKLILNSVNVTIYFKFTSSPENVIQLRLQNSPYVRNARAVKQKV